MVLEAESLDGEEGKAAAEEEDGEIEAESGPGLGQGAEIRLEDFEVRIGWNQRQGWYADCTIALRNAGDAEGTAKVVLEDGDVKLLKELEIKVPPKSTVTEQAEVDITGSSREVNSKLVG